jgi:hypothetical protein
MGARFANQPETEIARWQPDGAAPSAGVADEVGDVGAVLALGDPHAAVGVLRQRAAGVVQRRTYEACAGPFPDVAADIKQTLVVSAEASERMGLRVGRCAI